MHARVTYLEFAPENIDDAARLFEDAVAAVHETEPGFRGAALFLREDGKAMAINLAEDAEHLKANDASGIYQAEVAQFRSLLVGHPRREFFRVAVSVGLD